MRTIAAVLALLGVAGCAQIQAAREQQYADRCAAMGAPAGSPQFLQCRFGLESLDLQRKAELRRGLRDAAATLQAAQPTYWTAPSYPVPRAPSSLYCTQRGNQTQCNTY
jgi:hypothetical protein